LRRTTFCLFVVFSLVFVNVTPCTAINTLSICFDLGDNWQSLLTANSTMIQVGVVTHEDVRAVHMLAGFGFKINTVTGLWGELPLDDMHAIDVYYNKTLLDLVYRSIDHVFDVDPAEGLGLNPERVHSLTLGDEESLPPEWHPSVLRHNETFHDETGLWMGQPTPELHEILDRWIAEKTVWVYNKLYDYAKTKWSHLEVSQAWMPDSVEPGLKSDTWGGGGFLTGGTNNPWKLYHATRFSRTHSPTSSVGVVIWGTQYWPIEWGDIIGGFENMRTHAWVIYLSGIDHIAWFDMHPEFGWGWQRNDTLGKRLFLYQQRMNTELNKLPTLNSQPRVLVVGYIGDPELNFAIESLLLHEYDWTWEQSIAFSDMNLSKYDLVIIGAGPFHEETVVKLNDYVRSGGNLAFIGGLNPDNIYRNGTRVVRFFIEDEAWITYGGDHTTLNVSLPNQINLEMNYDAPFSRCTLLHTSNSSGDYHSIGEFYQIDEFGTITPLDGFPLVLYHNSSRLTDGYTLFFGYYHLVNRTEEVYAYSNEDQQFTRGVIRDVIRSFAQNLLGFSDTITTPETEHLLITQGLLEDGSILAGISNFLQNWTYTYILVVRDIDYKLDLDRFGLPDGDYWVHSLDKNVSLGQFASLDSVLTVPIHIGVNETRLLLISTEKPSPSYWINIFPPVPTAEEVEGISLIEYLEIKQEAASELTPQTPAPIIETGMLGFILVNPLLIHWRYRRIIRARVSSTH
jgi:hypothetical protein